MEPQPKIYSTGSKAGNNLSVSVTAAQPADELPPHEAAHSSSSCCWQTRIMVSCFALPFLLPICALWWSLAFILSWLSTFLLFPSVWLSLQLYWACPFIPFIWKRMGPVKGCVTRLGFESSYAINTITRMLTLPIRPFLPGFYIVGFPKCGTTSLAGHLRNHPGIAGPAGLPYHEALAKETHFFAGVLGPTAAKSATLYKSFFPTVMTRWWAIAVRGVKQWQCFDACPVHACLPHVARRIAAVTPNAKIVVMVRDPVEGLFSAEIMLRDLGVPLEWSFSEPPAEGEDPRFQTDQQLWDTLTKLGPDEPLPQDLPAALYFSLPYLMRCGDYAEQLQPYLQHFPPENIMVVNFNDYKAHPESVVEEVLRFVNADLSKHRYKPLPAAMKNSYAGRKLHPEAAAQLRAHYRPSVMRLQALLQKDLGWGYDEEQS